VQIKNLTGLPFLRPQYIIKLEGNTMAKRKKRLRAQITVGHDSDGNPVYKWASGYTKKELEANKEELRRAHINGAVAVRRDIFFRRFILSIVVRCLSCYYENSGTLNYVK